MRIYGILRSFHVEAVDSDVDADVEAGVFEKLQMFSRIFFSGDEHADLRCLAGHRGLDPAEDREG